MLKNTTFALLIALGLSGALLFSGLGSRSFRNPDEGRYAEIAKEMVVSGNWVTPKTYGIDYLRKPVLFYWLTALSFKCFGFSEFSARFVPALFGFLGVLMTFFFARKIFGVRTAFYSALLLISNFWYLQIGRYLLIDMVFSFFVVGGLYLFYLGTESKQHKTAYYLLFYVCVAFSVLAKGIIGIALAGLPIAAYLIFIRQFKQKIGEMKLIPGVVIFFVIAAPWFFAIESLKPGFLDSFFVHEHFNRLASKDYEHQEGWYYYLVLFPVLWMPWILLMDAVRKAFTVSRDLVMSRAGSFIGIATVSVILLYSLSSSKLLTYMLPAVFFSAVFLARGFSEWEKDALEGYRSKLSKGALLGLCGFAVTALVVIPFLPSFISDLRKTSLIWYFEGIAVVVLAGSSLGFIFIKKNKVSRLFFVFVGMMGISSFLISSAMTHINENYSTKRLAQSLRPKLAAGDKIFVYGAPGAFYDFRFYLDAPVRLVGLEGELELSKKELQDKGSWVTYEEFDEILRGQEKIYCLIRKSDFLGMNETIRKELIIVDQNDRKVLFQTRGR